MFYETQNLLVSKLQKHDQLVILVDLNARIGTYHDSWNPCLAIFGFGKINSKGQCLLEFCHLQNLCVTTAIFKTTSQHKDSWRHLRSKYLHKLDFILVRRRHINDVLLIKSDHNATVIARLSDVEYTFH